MKPSPFLCLAVVFACCAPSEAEWSVTLVQKQLRTNNTYQTTVSTEGRQVSLAPIPEGGAEFFLWAIEQKSGQQDIETLIDTEVVGAYEPQGSLRIITSDPYEGSVPRTRIDQGFTLEYRVEGLLAGGGHVPVAAQQVVFKHDVAS